MIATTLPFGPLLKQLRKQAGMTQRDLAAALGYSESLIWSLEKAQRQPDLQAVTERFIPALGLQDDPHTATALIEQAALARGERPPASVTFQRTIQLSVQDEHRQARLAEPVDALPSLPTELIGRAAEVNQLCNRLLGHSGRLLTLIGPPGIGKTTLALAVAARLQLHYPNGAVFVPLAAVSDPVLMAATILAAVGSGDLIPPKTRLIEFLRRKTILLVLDNLEQISDAAPLIAELVAECPGLSILATSRERLHLRAEQRHKVPALDLAASVELFTQRAQSIDNDFSRTPHNQPILEAICQRLDCLPLALELCAAQIDLFSPAQLLAQLQAHRLDLLVDGARDLPPQQRTLRIAIGRSYTLLHDDERALFRSLGVFMGGFDLGAMAMVANERLEIGDWRLNDSDIPQSLLSNLQSLIGKSLVRAETLPSGAHRFLLLETLREFALEQLHAQGEEAAMRQRHYAAYLHLFRTGDGHLRGPEAATWLRRLEPEQDNLRAALQWTLDAARYADMAWLLVATNYFRHLNGHRYETARWIARLLPHRQLLPVDLRLAIFINFISSAGNLEEFPSFDQYQAEIIDLMEVCPGKQLQAVAWHFLAQSDADEARAYALARAASEAPELGPEFGGLGDHEFILAANQLGYTGILLYQGEVAQATSLVTDSLQRFRRRGNQAWVGDCLATLGVLALLRGDIAEAHTRLQEVVTSATSNNLPAALAEWQSLLGLVTLYSGNATEARQLLEEGLRICLEVKNTSELARVCMCLAEMALWEGGLEQAAHWLGQSLAYQAAPQRITIIELQRLFIAGRLATAQQAYRRAATLFGLAEQAHSQIHYAIGGPMRALADDALATVREALDPALFAAAFATGQQMSLAEAFATMLTPRPIPGMSAKA